MKTFTPNDPGLPTEEPDGARWTRYIPESEFEAELIKRAMATRNAFGGWEIRDIRTQRVTYVAEIERGDEWDSEGRLVCQLNVYRVDVPDSPDRPVERFPFFLALCERPNAPTEQAVAVHWQMSKSRFSWPEAPERTVLRGLLPPGPFLWVEED
jgi:hypothetical protein